MTTVQVTAVFCALAWVGFLGILVYVFHRCVHDWDLIVEKELPSVCEVYGKNPSLNFRLDGDYAYRAGRKKYFAILRCKKCGKAKTFETLSGSDPG